MRLKVLLDLPANTTRAHRWFKSWTKFPPLLASCPRLTDARRNLMAFTPASPSSTRGCSTRPVHNQSGQRQLQQRKSQQSQYKANTLIMYNKCEEKNLLPYVTLIYTRTWAIISNPLTTFFFAPINETSLIPIDYYLDWPGLVMLKISVDITY
jgi:hypothetical protein